MRKRFSFEEAPRNALEWAFEQYMTKDDFKELAERAEKNAPSLLAGGYEHPDTQIDGPSEGGWDISKPSRLVVSNDAGGNGVVLWGVGEVMDHVAAISPQLQDLGLDDAPVGVSVWEGESRWFQSGWETVEWDFELKGAFRAPTEEEWGAIRRGACPWDKNEWLHPEASETLETYNAAFDAWFDKPTESE